MEIFILAVGKGYNSPENQLTKNWLKRLPKKGNLIEIESKLPACEKRIEDEGDRILKAKPNGAALAILDPKGKDYSSEELAELIRQWHDGGYRSAAFAIGGANGHSKNIQKKALKSISFGRAIWPHLLCRAMLAEQLYRANMILAGHPYHYGH